VNITQYAYEHKAAGIVYMIIVGATIVLSWPFAFVKYLWARAAR
jgi:hypothetical protein